MPSSALERKPSALQKKREQRTILSPRPFIANDSESSQPFEASLHQIPRTLQSEIALVFPDVASQFILEKKNACGNVGSKREYLAIPTCHAAEFPIIEINEETEEERLRIFLRFKNFAAEFARRLKQRDASSLVDIPDIDGSATFSRATVTIYDEVASTRSILGYSTFLYMGIQIVHHPRIGYAKLALHTMVLFARPEDARDTYLEMEHAKDYTSISNYER